MNTESRREFEEWAKDNHAYLDLSFNNDTDAYRLRIPQISWEAWQAAREREWMPIETAPKDQTEILTWDGKDYKFCQWLDVSEIWEHKRKMAWSSGYDYEYMSHYTETPTHWMPLPNPPTSEKI